VMQTENRQCAGDDWEQCAVYGAGRREDDADSIPPATCCRLYFGSGEELNHRPRAQNVTPTCPWNVLGVTKCVPVNVDRKLYKASLSVRLMMLKRRRSLALSV
jgi:hypothetical protein